MNWTDLSRLQKLILGGALLAFTAVTLLPFLYLVSLSLADYADTFRILFWPVRFNLANYEKAWQAIGLAGYFRNSAMVTAMAVALSILVGAPAAYAFSRFEFRGREWLYSIFLLGLTVPAQALVVPLFLNLKWLRLLNNTPTLGLVYPALGLAFVIFVMRGFFATLPRELADAAMIDGCSEYQTFWRVMFPLTRPALAAVAVFQFTWAWDEFLFAFTFITTDAKMTLPAGLARLHGEYFTDYPVLGAALVMSSLPIILFYLGAQRHFIKGMTMGALKQ